MLELIFDALRVGHMLAFAVGIGAAAFLELQVVGRFRERIDIDGLRLLLFGHNLIRAALIALWVTGLALLSMRIGVFDGAFTPKLAAKLLIVVMLTCNMMLIDRFVIPEIFLYEDADLSEIPAMLRLQLGAVAGFSAACWISALILGGIGAMKTMDAAQIAHVLVPIIVCATLCGAAAALIAGLRNARNTAHWIPGE